MHFEMRADLESVTPVVDPVVRPHVVTLAETLHDCMVFAIRVDAWPRPLPHSPDVITKMFKNHCVYMV